MVDSPAGPGQPEFPAQLPPTVPSREAAPPQLPPGAFTVQRPLGESVTDAGSQGGVPAHIGKILLHDAAQSVVRALGPRELSDAAPAESSTADESAPAAEADESSLTAGGGSDLTPPPAEKSVPAGQPDEPQWRREVAADVTRDPTETVARIQPGTHEIYVDLDHPQQALVDKAVESLADGVPKEWTHVPGPRERTYHYEPEHHDSEAAPPRLFVKTKPEMLPSRLAAVIEDVRQNDGLSEVEKAQEIAAYRAGTDPTSEIRLAPQIAAVIDHPDTQALAAAQGFSSVSYCRPLAAVIGQPSEADGRRPHHLVYQYSDGTPASADKMYQYISRVDLFIRQLQERFDQAGIVSDNLNTDNVLVRLRGNRVDVEVMDTEYYFPKSELHPHEDT